MKINAMEYGRLIWSMITVMAIFCLSDANYADAMDESSIVHFQDRHDQEELVQILSNMGFTSLGMHLQSSQDLLVGLKGPLTLFAPTEEAFRYFNSPNSSSNSSSDYLLPYHIAKGLFTYTQLQMLPDGTKLDTIASEGSLLVTFNSRGDGQDLIYSSAQTLVDYRPVYVNGVLVSHPDLLNDGLLTIHGVDQPLPFLVLESSSSRRRKNYYSSGIAPPPAGAPALIPQSSSASPGIDHPMNIIMPFMLEDAELSLRNQGYSILALAMRIKSPELLRLQNLTIFTLSDDSVFLKGGQDFTNTVRYHVVPNRRLLLADLVRLPAGTRLHTLLHGQSLLVTDNKPFSINHVGVKIPDAFTNRWIAVHEIVRPFLISSHHHHQMQGISNGNRSSTDNKDHQGVMAGQELRK